MNLFYSLTGLSLLIITAWLANFTNTTAWARYEAIQSDIFDHLLAILPEFGLRVFQHPSGADMRELKYSMRPNPLP